MLRRRLLRPARRDRATGALVALTAIAGIVAAVALWRAGILRLTGKALTLDDLDHVGSFLSGLLTPVALAWTAHSFVLQRRAFDAAVRADERAHHESMFALEPIFSIVYTPVAMLGMRDYFPFILHRTGGEVARVRVSAGLNMPGQAVGTWTEVEAFDTMLGHVFPNEVQVSFKGVPNLRNLPYTCWIVIRAERTDGLVSQRIFKMPPGGTPKLHSRDAMNAWISMEEDLPPPASWPESLAPVRINRWQG